MRIILSTLMLLGCSVGFLWAGQVSVVKVEVTGEGTRRLFQGTLEHADTGWDHYADRWEVLAPDGDMIASRTLYHPHVDEQPFSRSLSGVEVPAGESHLFVRGHDSVHGYGEKIKVLLP